MLPDLLAGFMAILAINAKNWRAAMAWLLVTFLIDGIDGTFALKFKVAEVLPKMNGKTIDNIIDFATYAIIPAYFFYMAELVDPVWNLPLTLLILFVSAIYYGKEGMVSKDYYFIGFPVMWNVVVFFFDFYILFIRIGQCRDHCYFLNYAFPADQIRISKPSNPFENLNDHLHINYLNGNDFGCLALSECSGLAQVDRCWESNLLWSIGYCGYFWIWEN